MKGPHDTITLRSEIESLYVTRTGEDQKTNLLSLPDDMLSYVIYCLRGEPVFAPTGDIKSWEQVIGVLSTHFIIPLLWYYLHDHPDSVLPPTRIREQMKYSYREASIRGLQIEHQIAGFLEPLRNKGIEPVILKGPALGYQVYPYPALRSGSDIDILIRPEQVEDTLAIFQDLGYSPHVDAHAASPHAFHHVVLLPPDRNKGLAVEVHWRLLFLPGEITPPLEELFRRAVRVRGTHGSFSALDIPDAFIYAATHMTIGHSAMVRLSWIADIFYLSQYLNAHQMWDVLFNLTDRGVLLAAVQRACKEAGFWFSPGAPYTNPDFFPDCSPESRERFAYLSAVVGRPERHLVEVFRDSHNIHEGISGIFHILFMTNEIDWKNTTTGEKIRFLKAWIRMVMNLIRLRVTSPSPPEGRV